MLAACFAGDLEALQASLDSPESASRGPPGGISPLSLCFRLGFVSGASLLLSRGHSLSDRDAAGLPPLYWALALNTQLDVVSAVGVESDTTAASRLSKLREALSRSAAGFRGDVSYGVKLGWLTSVLERLLPHDTCSFVVSKGRARIDFQNGDFDMQRLQWRKGAFAFILNDDGLFCVDVSGKRYANTLTPAATARIHRLNAANDAGTCSTSNATAESAVLHAREKLLSSRWPTIRSVSGAVVARLDRVQTPLAMAKRWLGLTVAEEGPPRVKVVGSFNANVVRCSGMSLVFCLREPLKPKEEAMRGSSSSSTRSQAADAPPAQTPSAEPNALLAAASAVNATENPIVSLFGPSRTGAGRTTSAISSFVVHSSTAVLPSPSGSAPASSAVSETNELHASRIAPGCKLGFLRPQDVGLGADLDAGGPRLAIMPPKAQNFENNPAAVVYTSADAGQLPAALTKDFVCELLESLLCGESAMEESALAALRDFVRAPDRGLPIAIKVPLVSAFGVVAFARVDALADIGPADVPPDSLFSLEGLVDASVAWSTDTFYSTAGAREGGARE
jgi:hypothetical protein